MQATPIASVQEEIIDEFALFDDPMMQYEYLIDLGKKMPPLDEEYKTEANIVKGCQSTVYLNSKYKEGKVHFEADSNTVITKGIIALLIRVLSGREPDEIINADLTFIDDINLRSHLSEQRSNGLNAMIKRMRADAMSYKRMN